MNEMVASLRRRVGTGGQALTVVCADAQNDSSAHPPFWSPLKRDLKDHVGNESETWKAVSGREDPWIRTRAVLCYWTDLCSSEDFPILTTAFQHKAVHMGTWHQDTLGRNLIIDFVVPGVELAAACLGDSG